MISGASDEISHAGYTEDGVLMGVPILTEPEVAGSNFNVPRSTFVDCMKALKEDARLALEGLPWEYGDAAEMQRLSAKYAGADQGKVTRVFGANFIGRMSGKVVEAFVAKADLLAASPAYSDQSGIDWKTAAAFYSDQFPCSANVISCHFCYCNVCCFHIGIY